MVQSVIFGQINEKIPLEDPVKQDIHPNYTDTKFTCSCGNVIETKSTIGDQHIEICNDCHPFYTGKTKLIDTAGRIDRFNARYKK